MPQGHPLMLVTRRSHPGPWAAVCYRLRCRGWCSVCQVCQVAWSTGQPFMLLLAEVASARRRKPVAQTLGHVGPCIALQASGRSG